MDSYATIRPSAAYRGVGRSPACSFGPHQIDEVVDGARRLVLVDCIRRVDPFRTYLRAIADGSATPDAFLRVHQLHSFGACRVPRVGVVAMQQRQHSGADEGRVESVLGASGVTEHAVDARAELQDPLELRRGLQVFPFCKRAGLLRDDVRLDALKLADEVM